MSLLLKRNGFFPATNLLVDDLLMNDLLPFESRSLVPTSTSLPSVNIEETEKDFKIQLAAPGLKKEDINIELVNNVLTISSEKQEEKEEKEEAGNYYRKEFNYQSFSRSFTLPENANESKIEATYRDGILHVDVAKKQIGSPKSVKNISIK
jgi:HSP20 family protein